MRATSLRAPLDVVRLRHLVVHVQNNTCMNCAVSPKTSTDLSEIVRVLPKFTQRCHEPSAC